MIMGLKISFISFAMMMLMFTNLYTSCSPIPGFNYPTPLEEAKLAGAVIIGIVRKISGVDLVNRAEVVLKRAVFLKGKGPRTVKITGWSSSAACGYSPPKIGDKVMVFVCSTSSKKVWGFNKFTIFTGALFIQSEASKESVKDVKEFLRKEHGCPKCARHWCQNCRIPTTTCGTRSEDKLTNLYPFKPEDGLIFEDNYFKDEY